MADESQSVAGSRMTTQQVAPLGGVDDGTMEELIEKLKMLDYDTSFPSFRTFRPLTRTYFSRPAANPNEQFFCFTSLVAWLLQLSGAASFSAPGQFDDPNVSSTAILAELKRLDMNVRDIAPGKLRMGYGDAVLHVLNMLLDKALVCRNFGFKAPEYPPDTYQEEEEAEVEEPGVQDDIQDEANSQSGAEEEWYEGEKAEGGDLYGAGEANSSVVETFVAPEEWRMELERVTPYLKLSRKPDHKDWRSHLDWISSLLKTIDKMYPEVRVTLEKVIDDINKASEKIQRREQSLSAQFESMVEEFKTHKREHQSIQTNAKANSEAVASLSAELSSISEMLEKAKADICSREGKMTDTSPLVRIKEAMSRIRGEVKHMELRIGVLQHTLLQQKLRHGRASTTGAHHQGGGGKGTAADRSSGDLFPSETAQIRSPTTRPPYR